MEQKDYLKKYRILISEINIQRPHLAEISVNCRHVAVMLDQRKNFHERQTGDKKVSIVKNRQAYCCKQKYVEYLIVLETQVSDFGEMGLRQVEEGLFFIFSPKCLAYMMIFQSGACRGLGLCKTLKNHQICQNFSKNNDLP